MHRYRSRSRLLALGLSVALVLAACGDSDDATPTTEAVATTVDAVTIPEELPAITPVALCVSDANDGESFDVAFGYVNDSDRAVVVDRSASLVVNGDAADEPFVTMVFAPGTVEPAFWITISDREAETTWTVTGPDGVARSATADLEVRCSADTPESSVTHDRTPVVAIDDLVLSADGAAATFTATLTGIDTSVCPAGLEPQEVAVTWDAGDGVVVGEGPTAAFTQPLVDDPATGGRAERALVTALVIERCASDGVVQPIWAGGSLGELYRGVMVCITELDGTLEYTTSQDDGGCQRLGITGGGRVRPA